MYRYQIRLPQNMALEDLARDLGVKGWMMIEANFDFSRHPSGHYDDFLNRIISILMDHVKTYDLCGADKACFQPIENKPLAYEAGIHASRQDSICHLLLENDLEQFLEEVSWEALDSIKEIVKPQTEIKVMNILQTVFRMAMADYIYFNPQCGVAEICKYSEEMSAWGRQQHQKIN